MRLSQSIGLFFQYFKEAAKEVKENFEIYIYYVIGLSLTTIVQNWLEYFFRNRNIGLTLFSKIVFSIVPLLITSKIIYVVKVRNTGSGDYLKTFLKYLAYTILYFIIFLIIIAVLFTLPSYLFTIFRSPLIFIISLLGLFPAFYYVIYYSFTPVVAALESDNRANYFSRSRALTKKNVWVIIFSYTFSLLLSSFSTLLFVIKESRIKFISASVLSIPEAFATIILTLAMVKIYFYLNELE